MLNGARTARGRLRASWLCLPLLLSCADAHEDETRSTRESVGGEVYRVFCMRAVNAAYPDELTGVSFQPACTGKGPLPEGKTDVHLQALVDRRARIVEALDNVLGDENGTVKAEFQVDEIQDFLASMIPLYDPPALMPETTRAVADVLARLLDPNDATGKKALDVLARTTGRVGYRPLKQALGVIRPLLDYPDLDDFISTSIALVAKGGKAEKEYDAVIHGLSLELATYEDTPLAPDSTLKLARNLLFTDISANIPDALPEEKLPLVVRDDRGVAVPKRAASGALTLPFVDEDADDRADIDGFGRLRAMASLRKIPAPFAVRGEEPTQRDDTGLATNVWDEENGERELFEANDMNLTLLAALSREQLKLLTAKEGSTRTTFEKLGRGLPALLGLNGMRARDYGKAKVSWEGPDLSTAPLLDLVHAAGVLAAQPETKDLLEILRQQMEKPELEPATAQLIETLLNIDARADMHPEAELVGKNGKGTPSRFWDDMIEIGRRMTIPERAGLIEAVMRSILDEDEPEDEAPAPMKPDPNNPANQIVDEWNPPCEGVCAPAQGKLLANWMRYKDPVNYPNAPSTNFEDFNGRARSTVVGTSECPEPAEGEPAKAYCQLVDRSAPDTGMNRSLFQRTLGMVHGLNGQTQMNKNGAKIKQKIGPLDLDIPLFDGDGWQPGQLFVVQDMVEIHILSVLNKATIPLKDGFVQLIGGGCNLGVFQDITCVGATQEKGAGIKGFDATPSPESLARFVFADPSTFVQGIADPVTVKDGAPIRAWEPLALFPMEVIDPEAKPLGQPDHPGLTFIQAGRSLMKAFNEHEARGAVHPTDAPAGSLPQGYLFGQLLSTLHMHWGERTSEPCMGPPANYESCTQSLDPNAPYYTYQSNLRSYEPLIAEAMDEERLLEVLYEATKGLKSTKLESGEDGITVLARFVEMLLRPMDGLKYRDGRDKAVTNIGDDVGYVSPLYLLLDALKGIDRMFEEEQHAMRFETWREARSELVDTMLEIETNGATGQKQMKDRLGRAVSIEVLRFLKSRIEAHEAAGDLEEWGKSFVPRVVDVLDRPVVGAALKLLDKTYDDEKAGAEFAKLTKYLFDEAEGSEGFAVTLLASGDLLQLLDDVTAIAPLLDLASEAVAPGVTNSVDNSGAAFTIDTGLARKAVEFQAAVSEIDKKRPSTTAKLLRNLVFASVKDQSMPDDPYTPLEVLLDAIVEVERVDPTKPSDEPLNRDDLVRVLQSVHHFITDEERGLERLYAVIQHRKRGAGE